MRLWVALLCCGNLALQTAAASAAGGGPDAVPPILAAALENFRTDPPKGWSFTQTTVAEGKSTTERCDATRPEFDRWALVLKDGRPPTDAELTHYREMRSRRSRGGPAPHLAGQLALDTLEVREEDAERVVYRCRLLRGESGDKTADHLCATLVLHKPTQTLTSIELSNTEPFRPALAVHITEMQTRMTFSLPTADDPSLLRAVTTRVRGTAFAFKSLDADMTVTFSDYVRK